MSLGGKKRSVVFFSPTIPPPPGQSVPPPPSFYLSPPGKQQTIPENCRGPPLFLFGDLVVENRSCAKQTWGRQKAQTESGGFPPPPNPKGISKQGVSPLCVFWPPFFSPPPPGRPITFFLRFPRLRPPFAPPPPTSPKVPRMPPFFLRVPLRQNCFCLKPARPPQVFLGNKARFPSPPPPKSREKGFTPPFNKPPPKHTSPPPPPTKPHPSHCGHHRHPPLAPKPAFFPLFSRFFTLAQTQIGNSVGVFAG